MSDEQNIIEAVLAARKEHMKDIPSKPEGQKEMKDRYTYSKNKRAQLTNGIVHVVSFKDNKTDFKYTVSVNASIAGTGASEEMLAGLQSHIAAFLKDVHEKV
jgi:hypothetical protein